MERQKNLAFVDAQNLYFGTTKCAHCAKSLKKDLREMRLGDCSCGFAWKIDLQKFRIYLKDNYHVTEAYYFLGHVQEGQNTLYQEIQRAGFIVLFKEHLAHTKSSKKGNVDTDIVFEVMKNLVDRAIEFNKVVLVSGDGDYKKLVDYLIQKNRFAKILFPNKQFASSLYKSLGNEYFVHLERKDVRVYFQANEKGA